MKKGKEWIGIDENTDKLVKHAMRTLLKSNYPGVMELFGYTSPVDIKQSAFQLQQSKISVGNKIGFDFSVQNKSKKKSTVRLEYAVHFLLANGKHSKKVFKISEREMEAGEEIDIHRKHDFRPITTRRYYQGSHCISIITNGFEGEKKCFELVL